MGAFAILVISAHNGSPLKKQKLKKHVQVTFFVKKKKKLPVTSTGTGSLNPSGENPACVILLFFFPF